MLGARLIAPAAAPRKARASSPPLSDDSGGGGGGRHSRGSASVARGAGLQLSLPLPALPDDFADRLLVGFFGTTVIGQLYTWPLALAFLYAASRLAAAPPEGEGPPLLFRALALLAAALLLLYLRFICTSGFREAEVTPSVLGDDDGARGEARGRWWQRAPLRRWRQWARLRRFVGATLAREGPPLDPSRSYVFAGFPHGISAISAFANLVVDPAPGLEDEGVVEEEEEEGEEQEAQSKRAAAADDDDDASPSSSPSSPPPSPSSRLHRGSFPQLFPGISMHAMTLASNFKAPLVREYCLSLGLRPATRTSCAALLTTAAVAVKATAAAAEDENKEATPTAPRAPAFRPAPGRAIFLAPGGAAEALLSREGGRYDVLLSRRKGFCRVALATGSDVVPVLMFGETELFGVWHPPEGSAARKLQRLSHRLFGTSQPLFRGEGLLGGRGLLPRRWSPGCGRPRLTTVVGQPVRVQGGPWRGDAGAAASASSSSWPPRIPKPGADPAFEAAVDALHARYCAALRQLFEAHKDRLHPGAELRGAEAAPVAAPVLSGDDSSSRMVHH